MSTYADEQGQWHPLRQGVPVPTTTIDANPQMHLCFNEAWMPAVITALKMLTRPEFWTGSDSDIRAAVREAQTLLGMAANGCAVIAARPNWRLELVLNSGKADFNDWNSPAYGTDSDGSPLASYFAAIWYDVAFPPDVTINGRALSDNSHVGGHIVGLTIASESDPAGQAYVLTTRDCLGNTVVHTDFTPQTYTGHFSTWRIVAGNTVVFFISAVIKGDYECASI